MALSDDIAALPVVVNDGDLQHNSHHVTLHKTAKAHQARLSELSRVDNTRDSEKPVSEPTQQAFTDLMAVIDNAFQGFTNGLDTKIDAAQAQSIATTAIAVWVGNTPNALDTLAELAAALGNDPNFATTVMDLIGQKAAVSHTHAANDIATGNLSVARGGTGRGATVDGSFMVGNGTDAYRMLTPAQVLAAIGAAAAGHTHHMNEVNGLIETFNSLQDLFDSKVTSYPGQTIVNWAGTQAAYDALPTSEKYAAGFIAAIY